VNDLTKMEEYLQTSEDQANSGVYIKKKLQDHFGGRIVITTTKKQANIVTLQGRASSIINEFYPQQKKEDCEALRRPKSLKLQQV